MNKPKMQTVPTSANVVAFLARVGDERQRKDSEILVRMMQAVSGHEPVMWGPAIVGFGSYHYVYDSGREGDMPLIGFSPRKGKIALYIMDDATKYPAIRERLGKYKTAKTCLYITKLADVDLVVLEELMAAAYADALNRS